MKKKYNKFRIFLVVLLILANLIPVQAQAAAKKTTVTSITLNQSQYVLKKGETLKLKASVSPAKAKSSAKLKWTSSNKKIATVTQKGVVKAKAKKGKVKITVTAGKKKASCKITIGTPVKKIGASGFTLTEGETIKIKTSVSPKKASVKTLSYRSSTPEIAVVDAKGNVTAKKQGTAQITITATDRKKVKKIVQVTVNGKSQDTYQNPKIFVNGLSEEESNNVIEEKISVAGTASGHQAAIVQVFYTLRHTMEEQPSVSGTAGGTENWKIENLPLQIGTNFLTVTAMDSNGHTAAKEIVLNRLNREIRLAENVVLFEEEKNIEIADDIVDYWVNDMGTEDTTDDLTVILFHENSDLVQSVKSGQIKTGNVIMLQPCESLYMGFNGVIMSHGEPEDSGKYPADAYETISFRAADFTDLFDGDVSLSYEIADTENPLAFAWFPTDVEIAALDSNGDRASVFYASEGYGDQSEEQQINGAGFQKSMIPYMMKDALNITGGFGSSSGFNLGITFKDAVLYDRDGSSKTKTDQIKIGGKIEYNNLKVKAGVEWHPDFNIFHPDLLPQQIIGKYEYTTNVDMHADWTWDPSQNEDSKMDLSSLVEDANKALNNNFENNKQFLGLTLSGVDMSDSIVLGMFGLQISPVGIQTTVGVKNTQYSSAFNKISAVVVIIPVLDVKGKISAKVGITYQYSAYHQNGINMQKKGFVGAYGSLDENKGQESINLPFDRSLEIYDICAKSEDEKDIEPEWSISLKGEGEALEEVAFGADIGLMFTGIIPASVKGRIYENAEAAASGEIKIGNGQKSPADSGAAGKDKISFTAKGDLKANMRAGLKAGAYFYLAAKTDLFSPEIDAKKEWTYDFCQLTIASVKGKVVKADNDADKTNDEALEGVTVRLTEKDVSGSGMGGRSGRTVETHTDAEGRFLFSGIKDGEYIVSFLKDGFSIYEEEISMEGENQELYITMEQEGFRNMLLKLLQEQGAFKANQRGTMHTSDDAWFNPSGMISAKIMDFDSDGADEMLVCYTKSFDTSGKVHKIYLDMYEQSGGKVVLADSTVFSAYRSTYDTELLSSQDMEMICSLNAVQINGEWCLMCEEDGEWSAFRDEMPQNYWVLKYQDNQFRYMGSLTGVEGVFFGFWGYEFQNGALTNSSLYYGDEYGEENGITPLYDDFAVAASAFFGKLGIFLKDDVDLIRDVELGTILSEKNNTSCIFEFTNKLADNGDGEDAFEFSSSLKRDVLLEEVLKEL